MSKVLVTGASGFIGVKLTERLVARGDDVACLVRGSSNRAALDLLDVRYALGDVRDRESLRAATSGVDVVYHLAGLTAAFRAGELMAVNAEGFRNVVAACAEQPTPPVVVLVSSLAAAGPSPPDRARNEGDPPHPVSHYGRAKRAAEQIAESYAARVPITIVRPPIVFGEGDVNLREAFRLIFRYGVHLAVGVAGNHYSLIHVRDLVDSLVLCAERGTRLAPEAAAGSGSPAGYYFVAGEEQPTFAELGLMISKSLGRRSVRVMRAGGPLLLWPTAALGEVVGRLRGRPHIVNFDKAREATAGNWVCASGTIRRDLGFAPQAPIVDRLRQTADWYRRENLL